MSSIVFAMSVVCQGKSTC